MANFNFTQQNNSMSNLNNLMLAVKSPQVASANSKINLNELLVLSQTKQHQD